jgi:DNA-binding SARP family transcriptional activator
VAGSAPFHVRRPRLTDRLAAAAVGAIVAGGGYGKSALARELSRTLGVPTITAVLDQEHSSADLLMAYLRSAAAALGLSDVIAQVRTAPTDDPAAQLRGLLDALEGQPALITVDEIQFADPTAVALLHDAASGLHPGHRLLLVGRHIPDGLESIIADECTVAMGITDLALTADELCAIAQVGFDQSLSRTQSFSLLAATDGWLAAVLLLFGGSRVDGLAAAANLMVRSQSALADQVDQLLDRLSVDQRDAVIQLAHLPSLDDQLVEAVTECSDLLVAVRAAGLPMTDTGAGTMHFIGPVRDALRLRAPLTGQTVDRAVAELARRAQFLPAVRFLLHCGRPDSAARMLSGLTIGQAEDLDLAEFALLVEQVPDAAARKFPRMLINLARACEISALTRARAAALGRAQGLVDGSAQPAFAREIAAELARDLVWNDRFDEADELAKAVLAETRLDEELTRARLLDVLGRVAAVQRDDLHLSHAQERLEIAANIYRSHEQSTPLAQLQMMLGIWVHAARGSFDEALLALDDALVAVPNQRRLRGLILTFRAELLDQVGRHEEATECLLEADSIALSVGDLRLLAYTAWDRARQASQLGDGDRVLVELAAVEANSSDWFDQSGCFFLAEAADFCDRVGLTTQAEAYLARALDHPLQDGPALTRAQLAIAARHGDPALAERHAQRMRAAPWFEPRDRWRVDLLLAYAAARRNDGGSAAQHAAAAFAEAVRLGYPQLPFVQERDLTEELLAIVGDEGRFAHVAAADDAFPVMVGLLSGFRITRAGRPIDVAPGQGRQLVKVLAIAGGTITTDQAIEHLWPDVDPAVGANRLRTVLNRLRESAPELVIRDDASLRLGSHVRTDISRFEHNAGRAQSLAAVRSPEALPVARTALAVYRGELLPEDPYEPWTAVARERLRRHAVSLLDICAAAAAGVGDRDEAVRCLQRACELEPYQEERYLAAARHLLSQGRRGAARSQVERARAVIAELQVTPPPALVKLERLTGAAGGGA